MKYLSLFLITIFLIIGCKGKSAEAYFSEAEAFVVQNNIADALAAYEKVVSDYPKSEYAPTALSKIASLYQNNLVPNITPIESNEKAVSYYRSIFEKFPEHEIAPVSLFMAGFILANELKKFDEATQTYNLFLKEFPDHELAASTREELEVMGLSPEEILKKKIATDL